MLHEEIIMAMLAGILIGCVMGSQYTEFTATHSGFEHDDIKYRCLPENRPTTGEDDHE